MEQGMTEYANPAHREDVEYPWGRAELVRKHRAQMLDHERRFGQLGRLQTAEEKSALAEALGPQRKSPKTPKPPVPTQKKATNNG